ncbi:MAG: hypothetical protein EAZ91_10320 [Cytophagales bacterium]|nr:MAG: hypothetical protein EAZ91_10320 [Cytophagales bacterium]
MNTIRTLIVFLLVASVAEAQNQAPTMQQSTSTQNTRQANPAKPRMKAVNPNQNREVPRDTARPGNRRKLRPDSLRRGGATKVDTIR